VGANLRGVHLPSPTMVLLAEFPRDWKILVFWSHIIVFRIDDISYPRKMQRF
jgi:hypothetical protein